MTETALTDAEILAFVTRTKAAYPPAAATATGGPVETRTYYNHMCALFRAPRPAGLTVTDGLASGVPLRCYDPGGDAGARPFVLYLHGGGFVLGSLDSHDDICAEIAADSGAQVFSADYRLAPEHIYPAQQDDTQAVWMALTASGRTGVVIGDSAGANLAAGLCLRMRDLGGPMPLSQVLIYPWLVGDALAGDQMPQSYSDNRDGPLLTTADCRNFTRTVTGGDPSLARKHKDLVPLLETDLAGLPPAVIITADLDPVRDDGVIYAARLKAAGVDTILRNEAQLVHGYLRARHASTLARASFDFICAAIRSGLETGRNTAAG
ncbi:alpha/beta hydrolase [Paracoccus sp. M683]|uniref:alpha/beta hydrolase n=1 Tax=Paracoccus sp. M683 TaxID=2594268 RepID=UPI00117D790E|nr:alpha/beta hydrolase [Paracoccus sp. M683]TRW99480.1 alpha/beta hydrolase [Paracoccus sp. M683]